MGRGWHSEWGREVRVRRGTRGAPALPWEPPVDPLDSQAPDGFWLGAGAQGSFSYSVRRPPDPPRAPLRMARQHTWQFWLLCDPRRSSRAMASGKTGSRWPGEFAMSAVV